MKENENEFKIDQEAVRQYLECDMNQHNVKEGEFEIDRGAVKSYFWMVQFVICLGVLGFCFVNPILPELFLPKLMGGMFFLTVLAVVYFFTFALWLCRMQATNLRYRLDGDTLRVDGGVFFLFRKSIPLERITDVALVQGPLLRFLEIWEIRVQTAGSQKCEAKMYGVPDPEKVRELILSQRHKIYAEKSGDA